MKDPKQLPPKWVKFFSWCFAYLIIIPLIVVGQLIFTGKTHGLSAYGFSLEGGNDPLHFVIMLSGVILLGSLTGIFVLTWRRYAYNFGIVYCLCALAVIFYGYCYGMPKHEGDIQGVLLICFLIHLIKHRKTWSIIVASKTLHSTDSSRAARFYGRLNQSKTVRYLATIRR